MAEFLTRKGISHHIDEIIKKAEETLVLISPYIKAGDETKNLLKNTKRSTDIRIIYGKEKLRPDETSFFEGLSIQTSFIKNLHAKCYLNEKEALLTSMNLYKFSQEHNDEMGILVSRESDPALYEEIQKEVDRLLEKSSVPGTMVEAPGYGKKDAKAEKAIKEPRPALQYQAVNERAGDGKARKGRQPTLETPKNGFCIRCNGDLPADPSHPYCKRCYASWKRYSNETYEEQHCHTCGNEDATTLQKPLCIACYRKYKNVFWQAA